MDTLKTDFNYKLIKNFLSKEEINLLSNYCYFKHLNNFDNFDFKQNNNGDTFFYNDPMVESLLLNKLKLVEKESNLKLFPTYSFWRMYSFGADLKSHKDRPSCEVSVTVQIKSCGKFKWPIIMEGKEIEMEDGDAVIYYGTESEHSRNEFLGDFQAQAFLHYVDQNGPFKDFKFDKRLKIGII
jgi:hypothetical protein